MEEKKKKRKKCKNTQTRDVFIMNDFLNINNTFTKYVYGEKRRAGGVHTHTHTLLKENKNIIIKCYALTVLCQKGNINKRKKAKKIKIFLEDLLHKLRVFSLIKDLNRASI